MTVIAVHSSAIRAIGYDGYTLAVQFKNGRISDYRGVPESVFHEFMDAWSKGRYYIRRIRGRYR
jgi:hypothetical protein